jgi:hypothetical protein
VRSSSSRVNSLGIFSRTQGIRHGLGAIRRRFTVYVEMLEVICLMSAD